MEHCFHFVRDFLEPVVLFFEAGYGKTTGKNMRDVITTLQERGVQTRAIWGLIHEQLPYQDAIAYEMEKAPYYSSCILNIPSSTQITDDDIGFVVEQIKVVFKSGI